MSRTLTWTGAALLFAAAGACAPGAAAGAQESAPRLDPLAAVVDSIRSTPPLDRTHWGIEIYDVDAGRALLRVNADKLFIVASNLKLATVAAALDLLGPEYRFTTRVAAAPGRDGATSALVVTGGGDPSLSGDFFATPLAALDSMADSLAAAGIRRVAGPIVMDQSGFDSLLVHPAWEVFDLDWYYAAPVAPFAVMEAAYPIVITPTRPGELARVEVLAPDALVRVDAGVRTVAGKRSWNDDLRRVAGTDSVVLRGEIGAGAGPDTSWIAQDEPGRFAGRALAMALEARGIPVEGEVVVARDLAVVAAALEGGGVEVVWRSEPLLDLITHDLHHSENWIFEMIVKTLGAEAGEGGSWSAGTAVVERYLTGLGIDPGAMYLRDGSGLSAQNLLTPHALVTLLRHARTRPWGPEFRSALPEPGVPGTLEERLAGMEGRVRAKTGSIRHVNSLSGYLVAADGRELVFSLLSNASGRPSSEVRAALDRIVRAIIENGR